MHSACLRESSSERLLRIGGRKALLLYEDDVVDSVKDFLIDDGWTIQSFARATEHGDDIVALRDGVTLVVEAKGEGSSKTHTARYGKPFSRQQVGKHVGVAVLRALRVHSEGTGVPGLAFPATDLHRTEVARVWPALEKLGLVVFWVDDDRRVQVQRAALAF